MSNHPPSQPWPQGDPNQPPARPWWENNPPPQPSRPWPNIPPDPMPPSQPYQIDMSRQYPPGHPWHDVNPSQMPRNASQPWQDPLEVPTQRTPSSPYRPLLNQERGSEGFYAPPPPDGSRNSGPTARRRNTALMAILAAVVVVAFALGTLLLTRNHPTTSSALAATNSPTPLGVANMGTPAATTAAPTPAALTPTVAVQTTPTTITASPTPKKSPTPTATSMPPMEYDDSVTGAGLDQFNFQGQWNSSSDPKYYMGTDSYSNDSNGSATFSFTGTRIQLIVDTNYNVGIMGISLDGGAETDVNGYSATISYQVALYTSGTLPKGSHTFKVFVTGKPDALTDYIDVDAVKVWA